MNLKPNNDRLESLSHKGTQIKNDEKITSGHEWIPGRRYVFLLEIDNKKTVNLGRFRRSEKMSRKAARLSEFKGYKPTIIDTKNNEVIAYK